MKPMVDTQLRTAFTFGNLDTLGNLKDPKSILKFINSYSNLSFTYTSSDTIEGWTYYNLPVHSSVYCDDSYVLFNLMFFDSNTRDCDPQGQEDIKRVGCVSKTQIDAAQELFRNQRRYLKYNPVNIIFSHQPVQNLANYWSTDDSTMVSGLANQQVTCDTQGSLDMADLFQNQNNVKYFICGKDTDNTFQAKPNTLRTTFMYTGGSGFTGNDKTDRQALILEVKENKVSKCDNPSSNIIPQYFSTS